MQVEALLIDSIRMQNIVSDCGCMDVVFSLFFFFSLFLTLLIHLQLPGVLFFSVSKFFQSVDRNVAAGEVWSPVTAKKRGWRQTLQKRLILHRVLRKGIKL